ncbi:MAG: PQ-loop domain-containing transporter [Caulobacterales bacterium]
MSGFAVEALGFIAGGVASLASAPQIIKIIRSGDAADVSRTTYFIMLAAAALWTGYGLLRGIFPIVLWNIVWFITSSWVLVLKFTAKKS